MIGAERTTLADMWVDFMDLPLLTGAYIPVVKKTFP